MCIHFSKDSSIMYCSVNTFYFKMLSYLVTQNHLININNSKTFSFQDDLVNEVCYSVLTDFLAKRLYE